MSPPHLPEDLSRWPDDPFALLGVSPGVTPQQLRLAYTALIRVYKPERFPEHFRRIREAYDQLRGFAIWLEQMESNGPGGDLARSAEPAPPMPRADSPVPEAPALTAEGLWSLACDGAEADAYRGLVAREGERPGRPDVCVRLYWLLALCPDLDPTKHRCDWLARGLTQTGLTYPLLELYLRELEADPEEARSERCARLLRVGVPHAGLAELARGRWCALRALGGGLEVVGDMEELRQWFPAADREAWVELLVRAIEVLAWDGTEDEIRAAVNRLGAEMDAFADLSLRLAPWWDRRDYVLALTADWHRYSSHVPQTGSLTELLVQSWFRPAEEVRIRWLDWLSGQVGDLRGLLQIFQWVEDYGPVLLGYVRAQLSRLPARPLPVAVLKDGDRRRLRGWAAQWTAAQYHRIREAVLERYAQEGCTPEEVAEAVQDPPMPLAYSTFTFGDQLLKDWPLRLTCLAHRVFWA